MPTANEKVAPASFPALESLVETDAGKALIARMETTARRLEPIRQSGTPEEKSRATAAITAYSHTMGLVREIRKEMDQQHSAAANDK